MLEVDRAIAAGVVAAGCCIAVSAAAQGPRPLIPEPELALVKAVEAQRIATIAAVMPSVVSIYGSDRAGGGGSGVLVDPAGYALTNHHVVLAAGLAGWAGLADGKLSRWKLIGTDPGGDLALIQLTGRDRFPTARLGDSNRVQVGDWALAAGDPFALAEDQQPTVTLGIVSGVHRYQAGSGLNQLVYGDCLQVDSSINPGNSGGPLFNLRGEVIGINGRASFEERGRVNVGLGFAISINQARRFLPELLATKIAQHGTLDTVFANREEGVVCQTINLESPAARARVEYELDGKRTVLVCDGRACQAALPGRSSGSIARGRALLDPQFAQAVMLAALLDGEAAASWGTLALDGADKAGGQLCYRLSITDAATSEQLFVWLADDRWGPRSVGTAGQASRNAETRPAGQASSATVRLVKTGVGLRDEEPVASTRYEPFALGGGAVVPGRRLLVRGLAEEPELEIQTLAAQPTTAREDLFMLTPP